MKNSIVIFLSIVSSILLLNGCSQNTKKEVKETKIKSITSRQINSSYQGEVFYTKVTTCNFDTLGRIIDSTITNRSKGDDEDYTYKFTYKYDEINGNLVELTNSYLNGNIISTTTYKYDGEKNILVKDFRSTSVQSGYHTLQQEFMRIVNYGIPEHIGFWTTRYGSERILTEYSYVYYK